jgi:hypothetical protein
MVKIRNPDKPMASPITSLEISADAFLSRFDIRIITIIQDHQLNITEDVLHRVIIGTTLRQQQFPVP